MGTVHRDGAFKVRIPTTDHLPMHVHVWCSGELAVFLLGEIAVEQDDDGNDVVKVVESPSLRENRNMKKPNVRRALRIICDNQMKLIEDWKHLHGEANA